MTNRSTFPGTIDTFIELSEVIASDSANITRYQQLLMQATLTSAEQTELNNLKTTLDNKIVSSEHFNYLQDCISNLEDYFLNTVMSDIAKTDVGVMRDDLGYPINLTTDNKTNIVNAINEIKHNTDLYEVTNDLSLLTHKIDTNNPHKVSSSQINIMTAYSDANANGDSYPIGVSVSLIDGTCTNYPLQNGTLFTSKVTNNRLFQLFFDTGADASHKAQPYYRFWYDGASWSSWYQFETTAGSTTKLNAAVQHTQGTKQMMLQKNTTGTLTVPASGYVGLDIVFDTAFAEVPQVVGTLNGSNNLGSCMLKTEAITTTGCKVWIYNSSGGSLSAIAGLLIYGTKSL